MTSLAITRRLRRRWVVCAMLFAATAINYVDRGILGVLAPTLEKEIGWTDTQYGDINAVFTLAYGLGFLLAGPLIDRIGVRWGYALYLTVWSLAAAAHALARSPRDFYAARFVLGLGEAGNFPAAIKGTAEWFAPDERAFATGIFNAGSNIGAVVAPLVVPYLATHYGWQAAFAVTGLVGLLWVAAWLPIYRRPHSPSQLETGDSPPTDEQIDERRPRVRWRSLLVHRQTWAFAIGKFLTDPIWWFYLFWSAKFFADRFGLDLKQIGPPLIVIYLLADIGSIGGGWLSSWLLRRGWSVNAASKTAFLVCALLVIPVLAAPLVSNLWLAVVLIGLAAAAHQGFMANLFTLTSDLFPSRNVGSVVGIGGVAGACGGILMQSASGRIKELTGSYFVMFAMAASVYLIALGIIQWLTPRLEPVAIE